MQLNIVLAPRDINFVPTEDSVKLVSEYLNKEIQDYVDFIDIGVYPRLSYIDEGDSFISTIGCPACKSKIPSLGDNAAWVQNLRETLISNQDLDLESHQVRMPCCENEVPVVALDFGGQAGFARFGIQVEGADIDEKEEELMREAGRILSCDLVKIELISS